ncbi:MAG: hypothetical protein [Microvirus sp.]|nr:MAG: hypothetical protein [Microvirus sp.]
MTAEGGRRGMFPRDMIPAWQRRSFKMKRHKLGSSHSKSMFKRHADLTHKKNMPHRAPMRGGIRL